MCNVRFDAKLTFDLTVMTLTYKIMSGLRKRKDCRMGVGVQDGCRCPASWCDLDLTFDLAKCFLIFTAIFETYTPITKICGLLHLTRYFSVILLTLYYITSINMFYSYLGLRLSSCYCLV